MPDTSPLAVAFGAAAQDYDRYRPGPPAEAIDWLLHRTPASVLDLAAGTGLLTRRLAQRVADVVAVEPDARMREVLAAGTPGITVLGGTGEHIPLPDARVEAVTVSAAWHWLEPALALPEIARVLTPGGTLGVLYTRRDRRVPWIDELDAFVYAELGTSDRIGSLIQRMNTEPWLPEGVPFTAPARHAVTWTAPLSTEEVAAMYGTYSRFITLPEQDRHDLTDRIEGKVRESADIRDGRVQVPMVCYCWRATRTAD